MRSNYLANVIAHSMAPDGTELLTFSLVYQRFIHAEFMTHRMASRNAASSRAIPVKKMLAQVRENPASPVHWGANQPGMQAHEVLKASERVEAERLWREAAVAAADFAEKMAAVGLHKQVANRVMEPFQLMQTVATATNWDSLFALRRHPDAQPEFKVLADMMYDARALSTPKKLDYGQWHLPYVSEEERASNPLETLIAMSAARCARVSYLNHEGKNPTLEEDMKLFERLTKADPPHLSPTEHQAAAMQLDKLEDRVAFNGNFSGDWMQYRKVLEMREEYGPRMQVLSTMFEGVRGTPM